MSNVRPVEAADLYAVEMVKKQQDTQKRQGEMAVRLIESSAPDGGPRKVPPGPDSTVEVVA